MARTQKLFKLYSIAEYAKDDGIAETVTYAKDKRGAKTTFRNGQHAGIFMLVWDNGEELITL